VLAGVLRDAEMVRLANVSWAVENLLKRTIPRVAQAADYADEGARAVIHALLLNLFVFLEHCMTMTRGNDPDVAYLFEAGEKRLRSGQPTTGQPGQQQDSRDFFEKALQLHCMRFLKVGMLSGKVEESDIAGGRADIIISSGKLCLVVEVKREDGDASFAALRSAYGAQATEYPNVNVRVSFLLVLDRTRGDGTAGHITDKVDVQTVLKKGDSEARLLVIISVPGMRKRPSELSFAP
jgi:hypothetical protein